MLYPPSMNTVILPFLPHKFEDLITLYFIDKANRNMFSYLFISSLCTFVICTDLFQRMTEVMLITCIVFIVPIKQQEAI